tara:strand:+ start:129 stop:599 length:471 start_codon:yes stop_codon:yes gene_type:complete
MTIMEAGTLLIKWFKENDYLEEDDFVKVLTISDTPERDRACLRLALGRLEEYKYIQKTTAKKTIDSKTETEERDLWVMEKPLSSISQEVEINGELAFAVAAAVNDFCDEIGDKTDYVNPTALDQKDLRNLVFIYNHRTEKLKEFIIQEQIKNDLDL